jgi:hypothetical protein
LPPIDELDFQSDYTAFLTENVPEELRRAALRKLWRSDPVLANLDGLNDYDEDYNLIDQVITLPQSSYRPGRGYLDESEKKLAQIDEFAGETNAGGDSDSMAKADRAADDEEAPSEDRALSDGEADADKPVDAARQSAVVAFDPASPERVKEPGNNID